MFINILSTSFKRGFHCIVTYAFLIAMILEILGCDPDCNPQNCDPLSGICTKCINNKVLDMVTLKCVQSSNTICNTIIPNCAYCQGSLKAGFTNCTKCISQYVLDQNANTCVFGNNCQTFLSNCQQCQGIYASQYSEQPALDCLTCITGFINVTDPTTNLGKCQLDCLTVHIDCVTCRMTSPTTSICTKCKNQKVAPNCVPATSAQCSDISEGCTSCEGALERTANFKCLGCNAIYLLSATNGLCKLDCAGNVDPSCTECYSDSGTLKCQKCTNAMVINKTSPTQVNCRLSVEADCKSIVNCISCEGGDPTLNTVSLSCLKCTNGQVVNNNGTTCVKATNSQCSEVTKHCSKCEGSLSSNLQLNCLECEQGFKLMTSQLINSNMYVLGQTYCILNCQNLTNYCIECMENIIGTICIRCKNYTVLTDDQRNCRIPSPDECGTRLKFCISCEGSFFPLGVIVCRQCLSGYLLITDPISGVQFCSLDCSSIVDCLECGGSPDTKVVCTKCIGKVPTTTDGGLSCRYSIPDDCTSIVNCQTCHGSLINSQKLTCLECLPTYCLLMTSGNKTCMSTPAILSNCAICQDFATCAYCINTYIVSPLDAKCIPSSQNLAYCSSIANCVLCEGRSSALVCKSCTSPTHALTTGGASCRCAITNCLECTTLLGNQICIQCGNGKFVSQDQKSCNDVMSKADCQMNITDCYICQGATTKISCIACLNDLVPNQSQKKCVECSTHIPDCVTCQVDDLGQSICIACGNGKLPSRSDKFKSCQVNITHCEENIHECNGCEGSLDNPLCNTCINSKVPTVDRKSCICAIDDCGECYASTVLGPLDLKCRFCLNSKLPAYSSSICATASQIQCSQYIQGCVKCQGDIGNIHCLACQQPFSISKDHRQCVCTSFENCEKCDADNSACIKCRQGYEVDELGHCQIQDCHKFLPGCGMCVYLLNDLLCLYCLNGKPLMQGIPLAEYYIGSDITQLDQLNYTYTTYSSSFSLTATSGCTNDIISRSCTIIANCLECKSFGSSVKCEQCSSGYTLSIDQRECIDQCKAAPHCSVCSTVDQTKCDFCAESFIRNTYNTCQCPIFKSIIFTDGTGAASKKENCMDMAAMPVLCPTIIPNCILCQTAYVPSEIICITCKGGYKVINSGRLCSLQDCSAVPWCSSCDSVIAEKCIACKSGYTLVQVLSHAGVQQQIRRTLISPSTSIKMSYFVNGLVWTQVCFLSSVSKSCLIPNCRLCRVESAPPPALASELPKLLCEICLPKFSLSLDMTFCRPNSDVLITKMRCSVFIPYCADCENDQETGLMRCLNCIKDHYLVLLPPDSADNFNNVFNRYHCFPADSTVSSQMSCNSWIPGCLTCGIIYITNSNATSTPYSTRYLNCLACDSDYQNRDQSPNATHALTNVSTCIPNSCQYLVQGCFQCNLDNSRCLNCFDVFQLRTIDGQCAEKTLILSIGDCGTQIPFCTACQINTFNVSDVTCYQCQAGFYIISGGSRQQCVRKPCPDGFFLNITSQGCQRCEPQCATCQNQPAHCLTCSYNHLQNPPLCNCPHGYYRSASNLPFPYAGSCIQQCGDTTGTLYVLIMQTGNKECRKCFDSPINLANCLMCARDHSFVNLPYIYYCKMCMLGYAMQSNGQGCQQLISIGLGGQSSLSQFMSDRQDECQAFATTIITSTNTTTLPNAFIPFGFSYINKHKQQQHGICRTCPETCTSCIFSMTLGVECTQCIAGLSLANGRCIKSDCIEGNYYEIQQKICSNCPMGCVKCRYLPTRLIVVCDECMIGFEKVLNLCRKRCRKRQYATLDGICSDCPDQYCLACTVLPESEQFEFNMGGKSTGEIPTLADPVCTACRSDAGYYLDPHTRLCKPAFSLFKIIPTCNNVSDLTISQNKYLFVRGSESDSMSCFTCIGCSECTLADPHDSSNYVCKLCQIGFYLEELTHRCVQLHQNMSCGQGEYIEFAAQKQSACERCMLTDCSKCFFKEECTACNLGFLLNDDGHCQMRTRCLSNQLYVSNLDACLNCADFIQGCLACYSNQGSAGEGSIGPSSRISVVLCSQCSSKYKLLSGSCYLKYNSNFTNNDYYCQNPNQFLETRYQTSIDGLVTTKYAHCLNCPPGCLNCTLLTLDPHIPLNCSTCEEGYLLFPNKDQYNNVKFTNSYTSNSNTTNTSNTWQQQEYVRQQVFICKPKCVGPFYYNPDHDICAPCSDPNCMRCIFDSLNAHTTIPDICTQCIDESFLLLNNRACVKKSLQQLSLKQQKARTICPLHSVINTETGLCDCVSGMVHYNSNNTCQPIEWKECQADMYLDDANICQFCLALSDSGGIILGICSLCVQSDKCLACKAGYFLVPQSNACQRCAFGCQTCISIYVCLQCIKGLLLTQGICADSCLPGTLPLVESLYHQNLEYFVGTQAGLNSDRQSIDETLIFSQIFISPDDNMQQNQFDYHSSYTYEDENDGSNSSSSSANIVGSNNTNESDKPLFRDRTLRRQRAQYSASTTVDSCRPVAINLEEKSICSSLFTSPNWQQPLPYKLDHNGAPEYEGQLVTLQCVYCRYNCDQCAPGFKLIPYDRSCVDECPYPLFEVMTAAGVVVCDSAITTSQEIFIDFHSRLPFHYGPYQTQNTNEDLILESIFNHAENNSNGFIYEWKLIKIQNGDTVDLKDLTSQNFTPTAQYYYQNDPQEPTIDLKIQKLATSRFVQDVQFTGTSKLIIPYQNLLPRLIYSIEVFIRNETNYYHSQIELLTISFPQNNSSFSEFNISSMDWGLSHYRALAGQDWVCAYYNFLNQQVLHLNNQWKYEFKIFPESTEFTHRWTYYHDSEMRADRFCFKIPIINNDFQVLIVQLTLSSGAGVGSGGRIQLTDKKMLRMIKASSSLINININSFQTYKDIQQFVLSINSDQQFKFTLDDCLFLAATIQARVKEIIDTDINAIGGTAQITQDQSNDFGTKYSQICSTSTQQQGQQCSQRGACIEWLPGFPRCECNLDYYGHKYCRIKSSQISEIIEQSRNILMAAFNKFVNTTTVQQRGLDEEQAKKLLEIAKILMNIEAFDAIIVKHVENILEYSTPYIRNSESARTVLKLVDTLADIYQTFDDQLFIFTNENEPILSLGWKRNSGQFTQQQISLMDRLKLEKQIKLRQYTKAALKNLLEGLSGAANHEETICSGYNSPEFASINDLSSSNVVCGKIAILDFDREILANGTQNLVNEVQINLNSNLDSSYGTVISFSSAFLSDIYKNTSTNQSNILINDRVCVMIMRYPQKMLSGFGDAANLASDSIEVNMYYNCGNRFKKPREFKVTDNVDIKKYVKISINYNSQAEESKKQCRWINKTSNSSAATLQYEGCVYNTISKTCDCLLLSEIIGVISDPIMTNSEENTNSSSPTNNNNLTTSSEDSYDYGNRPLPNLTSSQPKTTIVGKFAESLSFAFFFIIATSVLMI